MSVSELCTVLRALSSAISCVNKVFVHLFSDYNVSSYLFITPLIK